MSICEQAMLYVSTRISKLLAGDSNFFSSFFCENGKNCITASIEIMCLAFFVYGHGNGIVLTTLPFSCR